LRFLIAFLQSSLNHGFFGLFLETGILGIVRLAILVKVKVNESIGSWEVSMRSLSSDWHLLEKATMTVAGLVTIVNNVLYLIKLAKFGGDVYMYHV